MIGSDFNGDHFGFVTHSIGSFKRAGVTIPVLTPSSVVLSQIIGQDLTLHLI